MWVWISNFNNFIFTCSTLDELWDIGACIPLKDDNIIMIVIGAVLWNLWLERNRVIFKGGVAKHASCIGAQIIATARFWCLQQKFNALEKLTFVLPSDVTGLLGILITILTEDGQVITPMLGIGSSL